MADRFIITTQDGDVVELDPTEDSQVALAVNGIPTHYAIAYNCVPPLLPEDGGTITAPSTEPGGTEPIATEPATSANPSAIGQATREAMTTEPASSASSAPIEGWPDETSVCVGHKRKAAIARLDQLELN